MKDTVEDFNSVKLLPLKQCELFEAAKDCLRRPQWYDLSCGFAVIATTSKKCRGQFACIYHVATTKTSAILRPTLREMRRIIL